MNTQKHENKAFQALTKARKHLCEAEAEFDIDEFDISIEFAAIRNVLKTVELCQTMLNELQWTRVKAKERKTT